MKSRSLRILSVCAISAACMTHGQAAQRTTVACGVAIDYALNNAVIESYRKDFVVEPGVGFVDDFSTPTRFKRFTASTAQEGGSQVVSIDYQNDVDTFDMVGFGTRLTLLGGGAISIAAGNQMFATSLGVAGNHTTTYTLSCKRR